MCFQDLSFDIRLPIDVLFTTYLKIINFKDICPCLSKFYLEKQSYIKLIKYIEKLSFNASSQLIKISTHHENA